MPEIFTARRYEDEVDYQRGLVALAVELPLWRYLAYSNPCTPLRDYLDVSLNPSVRLDEVRVAAVFDAMGLDLEQLSQLFVTHPPLNYHFPWQKEQRLPARTYLDLNWGSPRHVEGWSRLARLVNKTIEFYVVNPLYAISRELVAVYHPSGEIAIINPVALVR